MRTKVLPAWCLLLALCFLLPPMAGAAEGYGNCTGFIDSLPANISEEGIWCLRKDLSTPVTFGNAIYIGGDDVTLDCKNHKVGGLSAGSGTQNNGIWAYSARNLVVRNCNIRGFLTGITVNGSGKGVSLIEDNRIEGSTVDGIIVIGGKGSVIRRNVVLGTGGSTWKTSGAAFAIEAQGGVNVIDNAINGVAPTADGDGNASAYGIYVTNNADGVVRGNRVRGLVSQGSGATYGIISAQSNPTSLRDNDLSGTGAANSFGLYCYTSPAVAVDNVVSGFETAVFGCPIAGNTLNPN